MDRLDANPMPLPAGLSSRDQNRYQSTMTLRTEAAHAGDDEALAVTYVLTKVTSEEEPKRNWRPQQGGVSKGLPHGGSHIIRSAKSARGGIALR